jgi:hypothetical protein
MNSFVKKLRSKRFKINSFFLLFSLTVLYCSLTNCNNTPASLTPLQEGEVLAKKHCNSCHKYPEPALLDQESWLKHVLPAMAPRFGIQVFQDDQYVNNPSANTTVTYTEWLKIVGFYKASAPKTLKAANMAVKPLKDWAVFSLIKPSEKAPIATTTLVAFDTVSNSIYTSDMMSKQLYQWSDQLKLKSSGVFSSPAVNVQFNKSTDGTPHNSFTFIGSMDAVDVTNGYLTDVEGNKLKEKNSSLFIAEKLARPVQSLSADFNKDGLTDWLVCEFGHNIGGLSLFSQQADKSFKKATVRNLPGAEHAVVGDFNKDGWTDVVCLFGQGDEGIYLFLNDHKGGFTTSNLLRFPPVYGSSSFQLVDFNKDGKLDILYTCGDNSDYSRVLKPYHGVYIFLNQGGFKYKQSYFYHINGATKAMSADFNGDGQLDIAAIAFFSDLKSNPDEGFTYLEQKQPMKFMAHHLPIAKDGRWVCMDVADYNHDGKPDLILGNFSFGFINQPDLKPDWDASTPYVILLNSRK